MTRSVEEIEEEVRSLGAADRDRLLRYLIADMDGEAEADVERAWLLESRRRYQELRDGEVEAVPAEEAIREARLRLRNGD